MATQTKKATRKTVKTEKPALKTKPEASKKIAESAKKQQRPVLDDAAVDAFIMEVDDEVKSDRLKAFFQKYGLFVVLSMVLILSAALSFETIKNWRENQFINKTNAYIASNMAKTPQETLTALEKIAAGNYGIYSELARIQIAEVLFDMDKTEDAMNMLQSIASNDELNQMVRNMAAVKLAARKVDTASFAEIEDLLTPVIAAEDSWSPIAKEYLALAAIEADNTQKARELYEQILQDGQISDDFRARVQDMLTALSDM